MGKTRAGCIIARGPLRPLCGVGVVPIWAERSIVDKLLMNPKEAAEMLSISRSKLYELLADGKLTSVRIDGCRRIAVDVLRAYVDELRAAEIADSEGVAAA